MDYCGYSIEAGEFGYCRKHTAELIGVPKHRIDYLIKSGRIEAFRCEDTTEGYMICGVKAKGDSLVAQGQVIKAWSIQREGAS